MSGRLQGKTALITAAGQGIGFAAAMAMAAEGARVHATDVNPRLLDKFAGVEGVVTHVLDVLDDAAIATIADELPPLDILFNCAGYVHHGTILDCTPKDWAFSFNLNVRAMYATIRATLPKMLAKHEQTGRASSIVNMASIASSVKGLPSRFRHPGHSVQRDRPRDSRHAVARRSDQRVPGPRRGAEDVRRPPADGPARQSRGDRAARRFPGVRRSSIRHR